MALSPATTWRSGRWPAIVLGVVVAGIIALLLLPHVLVIVVWPGAIRNWADRAVQSERPFIARWLLRPLADGGDPIAQNNLAVLIYRQARTSRELLPAEQLLRDAAARGLPRAKINLVTIRFGRCGLNTHKNARAAVILRNLAGQGDMDAASHMLDCLYFIETRRKLVDAIEMLTGVADEILKAGSPDLLLKAGQTILDFARTTRQPTTDLDQVDYNGTVVPLVHKAKLLLFAAAAAGRPEAYEWIGIMAQQFAGQLGDDKLSQGVRGWTRTRWSTTASVAGAWDTVCRIAESSLTRIRSERGANAEQYSSAMQDARECLDRAPQRRVLIFEKVYLAYQPRSLREPEPPPTWHAVGRLLEEVRFIKQLQP